MKVRLKDIIKRLTVGLLLCFVLFVLSFAVLDAIFPLDLSRYEDRATKVLAKDGELLRAFTSSDDKWRFASDNSAMPIHYWQMLISPSLPLTQHSDLY